MIIKIEIITTVNFEKYYSTLFSIMYLLILDKMFGTK